MKELVNVKFKESLGDNTEIEEEIYSLDTIIYEGDLILDGYSEVNGATLSANKVYSFGSSRDVSNGTTPAEHTVVFKVIGNLTIKEGVSVTTISGAKGGPKGFVVYCTGEINNEGNINMNKNGAYAQGQNIYLYKNSNDTYEFVPKIGGAGRIRTRFNYDRIF